MDGPAPEWLQIPAGQVLHTLCWTNHLAGCSTRIELVQAPRRNQVIARTWSKTSAPHGLDWFARHLRARLVTRWLPDG